MGLDELKSEIVSRAKEESRRILQTAEKEAAAIRTEAKAEAERRAKAASVETERQVEALRQRELASAALERKKRLMAAKRQVMDEAFTEAERQLLALPNGERKRLLNGLLKRASSEIAVAKVMCNAKDVSLVDASSVIAAEIRGGLIAETKDGSLCVDCSFETLLDETRERKLEELAKILFPAG